MERGAKVSNDWRSDPEQVQQAIREARAIIDYLDRILVDTLHHRARLVRDLHRLKRLHDLPIRDPEREANMAAFGYHRPGGYPAKAVRDVFTVLFAASEKLDAD
jgi:chorismate mutase